MRRSADRFPRTQPPGFGLYLLAAAITLLCLQAIIYLYVLRDTVGPFSIFGEPAPDPSLARKPKVVLVRSEPTARLWAREGEIDRRVEQWAKAAQAAGMPVETVSDAALPGGLGDAAVLVLPGAACLGAPQRQAILDALKDGRGVVASGATGSRSADCSWQGFDLLQQLTAAESVESLPPASAAPPGSSASVAFRGQRFYSERVPPGYKMSLPAQELTVLHTKDADAYWSDWMLRPARGTTLGDAGVAVHAHPGSGRVVWFGFSEVLPRDRAADLQVIDGYLVAALRWAGKQPLAAVGTWPEHKDAATLVAEQVEPGDVSVEQTARLLADVGIPGSFFLLSAEAKARPEAVRRLAAAGEVGSSGDSAEPLVADPPARQRERLQRARQETEAAAGAKVLGFAPPQGLSNTALIAALNDAGFRYYLNEMGVTRAVPEIVEYTPSVLFPLQKTEVLKVFRTSLDDFEVIADYQGPTPRGAGLAEGFLKDFHRLHEIGGLYTLSFHSHLLGAPEYREALERVVREIKAKPVWSATGQQLAAWWSGRNKLEVTLKKVSVHRVRLDVANKGPEGVDDASVYVYLPYRPRNVRVRSTVFRFRTPTSQLLAGADEVLRIDFPSLSAQTNYTYTIALDEE